LLERGRPVANDEVRAHALAFNIARLIQTLDDELADRRRGARVNEPQIDSLPLAVLAEEHDVLVGAPDRLLDIPLRLLQALGELPLLTVIEAELRLFIGDVFPGKHLPRVIAKRIRSFRDRPNEPTLERARPCSVLLRRCVDG